MIELDKQTVEYLHDNPCFVCRYSDIDPYDWGLRCCNGDSEHCTEICPDTPCEHLDIDPELSPRLKAVRDLSEADETPCILNKCVLTKADVAFLKYRTPYDD